MNFLIQTPLPGIFECGNLSLRVFPCTLFKKYVVVSITVERRVKVRFPKQNGRLSGQKSHPAGGK